LPKLPFRALVFALTLTTVGMAGTVSDEETLSQISPYRDWSRLTEKPTPIAISSLAG